MKNTNKAKLTTLLVLVAAIVALVGCGAAPASQTAEVSQTSEAAKVTAGQETSPTQATTKMFQADSLPPKAAGESAKNEPAATPVEIGYKIGMQAPDFGMSLSDGTRVTSASIVNEGKPVFIYFHATW